MIIFSEASENDVQTIKNIAKRAITTNYTPFLGAEATAAFIESGMSDKEIDDGIDNCTVMLDDGGNYRFCHNK